MIDNHKLIQYNEDTIFTGFTCSSDKWNLVLEALLISIKERDFQDSIKIKKLNKIRQSFFLNDFHVQVLICSHFDQSVNILDEKLNKNNPQFLLLAQVDDENNMVYFPGVINADEFNEIVDTYKKENNTEIPISNFNGGIDLLFSYVNLLNSNVVNRILDLNKSNNLLTEFLLKKNIRFGGSIIVVSLLAAILTPKLLQPDIVSNIENLEGNNFLIASNTRSKDTDYRNVCILSPQFLKDKNINYISVDKPVFIFKEKLNEITLIKDNNIIWQDIATLDKRIQSPIIWPINPIASNKIYTLRVRPVKSSLNEFKEISFKADNNSFQKIDLIEEKLGKNESRWINQINKNLNKNPDLSIALLFSENSPNSEVLEKAKNMLLNNIYCKD